MRATTAKSASNGLFLALIAAAGLAACGTESAMNSQGSRAQFAQEAGATAINALGQRVALADFAGSFVWVDYAAEWCAACAPQSGSIRSLDRSAPADIVFVTVMTSEREGYGHPATRETATRWANSMSLAPERVVAADLTSLSLPRHVLFSPQGEELYRHTGLLSTDDIRAVLASNGRKL